VKLRAQLYVFKQ
jgi:hypothetical protein